MALHAGSHARKRLHMIAVCAERDGARAISRNRRTGLGIACWAQPAFILRQGSDVLRRLQALLMIRSAAVPVAQDDIILLAHHARVSMPG